MHRVSFELVEHALIFDRSSPIFIYDRSLPSYIADRFDKLQFHSVVANLLLVTATILWLATVTLPR